MSDDKTDTNSSSDGIKIDAPNDLEAFHKKLDRNDMQYQEDLLTKVKEYEIELEKRESTIAQLTAMCYTLARRLRNESFADNITAVQRQQMAELAMQSLNMTPQVWDLVHRSEEQQRQEQ